MATVDIGSKPHAVDHLKATWRKSAEHLREQVLRFLRLFAFAAVVPLLDLIVQGPSKFDWASLFAALIPVFETTYRQFQPAMSAGGADSAPGVTIVPDQVELPVQTDNGPRPEDPSFTTPENQDPNYDPQTHPDALPPDAESDAPDPSVIS